MVGVLLVVLLVVVGLVVVGLVVVPWFLVVQFTAVKGKEMRENRRTHGNVIYSLPTRSAVSRSQILHCTSLNVAWPKSHLHH